MSKSDDEKFKKTIQRMLNTKPTSKKPNNAKAAKSKDSKQIASDSPKQR
jgi:hypothetical protein